MPELPEVETTIRELQKIQPPIVGAEFVDVWTDSPNIIKRPKNFEQFKLEIKNKKIQKIWRRAKFILFDLSQDKILLIHQKLTGHLLVGRWKFEKSKWKPLEEGVLADSTNCFIHLMFWLDQGLMLALSDLRKFARVELWDKKELLNSEEFKKLGPEPLEKNFNLEKFKEVILKKKKGKIKQVLMDQEVIAGIGNIYSDEILWLAEVNPFRDVQSLTEEDIKKIYVSMKEVLSKAIQAGGESFSDYRKPNGEKGNFDKFKKVYRREGEKCLRCGGVIKREKINGRSAHFCPNCQK